MSLVDPSGSQPSGHLVRFGPGCDRNGHGKGTGSARKSTISKPVRGQQDEDGSKAVPGPKVGKTETVCGRDLQELPGSETDRSRLTLGNDGVVTGKI